MRRFDFNPGQRRRSSPIFCGARALDRLTADTFQQQYSAVFIVVDQRVHELFANGILAELLRQTPVYLFPRGERYKSLHRAQLLLEWLSEHHADRHSLLLGIGGGVVTDIAGFVASSYKRGIAYVPVPTTLLAQIDAAIGGKTAVNLRGTKNVVGSFYSPEMVICDSRFLATLRANHVREGLVEAFKLFAIRDKSLFDRHATRLQDLLQRDRLEDLIADAVAAKLAVVNADPYEQDLRRVLNFGHTVGHALESEMRWSHGKSVGLGILVALILSTELVSLSPREHERVWQIVTAIYDYRAKMPDARRLWTRIQHDKKRLGEKINFVLVPRLGTHKLMPVTLAQFARAYANTMKRIHR